MSYCRTPEHRGLRAELIGKWNPSEKSTGPKTPEGKVRSAMRGDKGGTRAKLRALARLMRTNDGRDPFETYDEMQRLIDAID